MPKTRTLAIILNHNLPEFTDRLFQNLEPFQADIYDLRVMDNGSRPEYVSKYTTIKLPNNIFWGGALNEAFSLILENPNYDSLLFLNNDLEVTGEIFVEALRNELFCNNYAIVTPCIAGDPRPWKQMQNWGSKSTRQVRWIDNQAPLFHRKIIEKIKKFDKVLNYGWGQEFICFEICVENGWKIGVCDHITMLHYAKQTILQKRVSTALDMTVPVNKKESVDWKEFEEKAMSSYVSYFIEHPLKYDSFDNLREYGLYYSYKVDTIKNFNFPSYKTFKNLYKSLFGRD